MMMMEITDNSSLATGYKNAGSIIMKCHEQYNPVKYVKNSSISGTRSQ